MKERDPITKEFNYGVILAPFCCCDKTPWQKSSIKFQVTIPCFREGKAGTLATGHITSTLGFPNDRL